MDRGSLFFDQVKYKKMKSREIKNKAMSIALVAILSGCLILGVLAYITLPACFSNKLAKSIISSNVDTSVRSIEISADKYSQYVATAKRSMDVSTQLQSSGQCIIDNRIEQQRLEEEKKAEEERRKLEEQTTSKKSYADSKTVTKLIPSSTKKGTVAMGGDNKPASIDGIENFIPVTPENLNPNGNYGIPEYWPIQGCEVSSEYGNLPERGGRFHAGVDLVADKGTPICAAGAGKVIRVANSFGGYGMCIDIQHSSGYITRYGHLSGFYVSVGDFVNAGDWIGACGSTGRSTCPHLHFEVHKDGSSMNPEHRSLSWTGKP